MFIDKMPLKLFMDSYFYRLKKDYSISRRELQILKLLVTQGKSNRELAQSIGITESTMKNHLAHIFTKTKTNSARELQALIFRDLLSPMSLYSYEPPDKSKTYEPASEVPSGS
ncbi:hypothetical protein YDYSY3_38740 [Paenibacillus chitinolyticus]|uniref:helix-turn-helix transcriptional regulator n=1 Tax=Paenibacillus chitinolyticus TaxID=79263 RepID=UPI0026E4B356|nr:helix-turn-helix transcriptional regulator [Paenibacillus chitinolyticus]GKS12874.1 hypothetical protein YDYSY3_38740 [Paenibacillus chitinolyticus]